MQTVLSDCWKQNEIGKTELVVNRLRADMVKRGDMMSSDDVVEILAVDLLGVVPDDENIVVSTNQGEPLVGNKSLAGQAYETYVTESWERMFHCWIYTRKMVFSQN